MWWLCWYYHTGEQVMVWAGYINLSHLSDNLTIQWKDRWFVQWGNNILLQIWIKGKEIWIQMCDNHSSWIRWTDLWKEFLQQQKQCPNDGWQSLCHHHPRRPCWVKSMPTQTTGSDPPFSLDCGQLCETKWQNLNPIALPVKNLKPSWTDFLLLTIIPAFVLFIWRCIKEFNIGIWHYKCDCNKHICLDEIKL